MNIVVISPNHPHNMQVIVKHLYQLGATICGICDNGPIEVLPLELQSCLKLHYNVQSFYHLNELEAAVNYFQSKLNRPIDAIVSLNESFLAIEAQLRAKFNIVGDSLELVSNLQKKSYLKDIFEKNGIPCAKGGFYYSEEQVIGNIQGFPIIAKPDTGMGAIGVVKIHNQNELKDYFQKNQNLIANHQILFEEFIQADLYTLECIINSKGEIVFAAATKFSSGVMEMVHSNDCIYILTLTDIPTDLLSYGKQIVEAFSLFNKFIHIEFFRKSDGSFIVCEVNFRIPGGPIMELHQLSLINPNFDIFDLTAKIILNLPIAPILQNTRQSVAYVGRRDLYKYKKSTQDIMKEYSVIKYELIPTEMERVFGKGSSFIIQHEDSNSIQPIIDSIQEKC